ALLGLTYRFPYKAANAGKYWPGVPPKERRERLLANYRQLLVSLQGWIGGIDLQLPEPSERVTPARLKRYEDALDALVCCWVGMRYLDGAAHPFGDETAAIWCPTEVGIVAEG